MKKEALLNVFIGFVGVLLVFSLVSTLMVWLKPELNPNIDNPNGDDVNQTTVAINSYQLYEDDDLSFRFIVANITLTSEEPQRVSLNQFVTSQQVSLHDVQLYLDDLISQRIDLSLHDIDLDVFDTTSEITLNLFIPLRLNNSDTLTVYFQGDQEVSMLFDLNVDIQSIQTLVNLEDIDDNIIDQITLDNVYRIKIVEVTEIAYRGITETLPDGTVQEMVLPSTARVVGVLLEIESLGNQPIVVEAARYRIVNENQTSVAFDDSVDVEGFTNIVSKEVYNTSVGFVFFDIYSTDETFLDKMSEFEFKLNVSDQWIRRRVVE